MTQDQALYILESGQNVYLTGAAGSGKTYVLNKFISELKKRKVGVGVTASTGIAATHLGGITIHSWAGMGIARDASKEQIQNIIEKRHVARRLAATQVLIIDEISMLDADRLALVDRILKAAREKEKPFGGIQVVLCGDFFQLPPIQKEGEPEALFAYRSPVWQELNPIVCYLTEQHRQGDDPLAEILNAMRAGEIHQKTREHLHARKNTGADLINSTRLYCKNINVDAENARELQKLQGAEKQFYMSSRGVPAVLASLKNGCLAPELLAVKRGAAVMFVKNNFDKGYVNGTLGTVVDFSTEGGPASGGDEDGYPVVKSLNGRKFIASPETWKIEENGKTVASIMQVPLRLAWAITVHKSQGMTLDAAQIQLTDAFEKGMGYVALSRVKSLAGMRLLGFNEMALRVHEDVLEFDKTLRELSEAAMAAIPSDFSAKGGSAFGGKDKKLKTGKMYSVKEIQKVHTTAYEPWDELQEAKLITGFKAGIKTAELAQLMGRQVGGIRSRLKKLGLVK